MTLKITLLFAIIIGLVIAQRVGIKVNYTFDDEMDEEMRQIAKRRTEKYLDQKLDSKDLAQRLENDLTKEFGDKVFVAINENGNGAKARFHSHLIWDMIIMLRTREAIDAWWDANGK